MTEKNSCTLLTLLAAGLVVGLFWPNLLAAHTSIAVNGSASLTLSKDKILVDYRIECGALTAVDMRNKIDADADGTISEKELTVFNEATQDILARSDILCFLLLDAKPVRLIPQKAAFALDGKPADGALFLDLQLASAQGVSVGPHRIVIDSVFCPLDAQLLRLPENMATRHSLGKLVRVLCLNVVADHPLEISDVSGANVLQRAQKKTVHSLLNNITKRVQINFDLVEKRAVPAMVSSLPLPFHDRATLVDAVTAATPITRCAPVRITEISTFDALTFDPKKKSTGTISYVLSRSAWVRIRIVLRGNEQLVLRTLVDWSKHEPGKHTEQWDGRDDGGHLIDKKALPCFIIIEADSKTHQEPKVPANNMQELCSEW